MAASSGISWTTNTWNPWTGCKKVSAGCAKCYAEAWAKRAGRKFSDVKRSTTWGDPARWQKRLEKSGSVELVFTCSLSDFLIEDADGWRDAAWRIMRENDRLIWQVLTKRLERFRRCQPLWHVEKEYLPNCWFGTSAEDQARYNARIPLLAEHVGKEFPVAMLSLEPLLGPIELDLAAWAHQFRELWIITGAESGSDRRPFEVEWAADIAEQCSHFPNVSFYFKQGSAFKPDQPCGVPEIDAMKAYPSHLEAYAAKMKQPAVPTQQLLI